MPDCDQDPELLRFQATSFVGAITSLRVHSASQPRHGLTTGLTHGSAQHSGATGLETGVRYR